MNFLQISLTNRCGMSCPYCPIAPWRNHPQHSKDMDIAMLTRWLDAKCPPGEWHLELTGGEPTMHDGYLDLCGWLDGRGYVYVTKSNGTRKGRFQASAWHGGLKSPPKHWDMMLIIADTDLWISKEQHCRKNGIPHIVIAKDDGNHSWTRNMGCVKERIYEKQAFVCPDGKIKPCPSVDTTPRWLRKMDSPPASMGKREWCRICKAEFDFAEAAKMLRPEAFEGRDE